MTERVRIRNPCDGCTLRRVKCEDTKPCYQCRARGIECTTMQARQKRGPKGGPRHATSNRIREFQRRILEDSRNQGQEGGTPSSTSSPPATGDGEGNSGLLHSASPMIMPPSPGWAASASMPDSMPTPGPPPSPSPSRHRRRGSPGPPTVHPNPILMDEYRHFLHLFRQQAFPIWPVVDADDLLARLGREDPDPDPETLALAASLCAATIAQLRLAEHAPGPASKDAKQLAAQFATECLWFRELYDYRETYSPAAVLVPFFLHIYYANTNKLRTAGFFLRESITYVHAMDLGRPETYGHLPGPERSLRLRIYWLLFISERKRTYCVQHLVPAILRPIDTPPEFDNDSNHTGLSQAFRALSRLFVYLDGDFTTPTTSTSPPSPVPTTTSSSLSSPSPAGVTTTLSLERQRVASYQASLSLLPGDDAGAGGAPGEAQRVDLFVTRQWIRLLLWEYTARRFAMACCAADPAFSLFLPVKIGHELLGMFAGVTEGAVKTHGYGMELKVFRLADSLLDLVACASATARSDAMLVMSGDILYSFRRVLAAVGGRDSVFLQKLHVRMSQLEMDTGAWPYHALMAAAEEEEEGGEGGGTVDEEGEVVF